MTGSGKGIGRGIALGLAQAGADIVIAARNVTEIEAAAAEIRAVGRRALVVPADVCSCTQVANIVEKTMEEFGRIDVLVNNAGGVGGLWKGPFLEMNEQAWDDVVTLNLKSVFLCTRAVAPVMVDQKGGSIINISSLSGVSGNPGNCHYAAAKAGIINLTQTLGFELARHNIRINCIAPGNINTPRIAERCRQHPEWLRARLSGIPMKRFGTVEDIAALAVYLASDASSYVTGETIIISGGATVLGQSND